MYLLVCDSGKLTYPLSMRETKTSKGGGMVVEANILK
jgi:hypothetical protein